jgi:hypothetical protein
VSLLPLVLWAQVTLVTVRPGSEATCPSPGQISTALRSRVPGALVPADRADEASALVVEVQTPLGAAPELLLTDGQGQVRLARTLSLIQGGRDDTCVALAETVALIVERYLQELDYRGPIPAMGTRAEAVPSARARPAPPSWANRRWDLSLASAWRPGLPGAAGFEVQARAGRLFGERRAALLTIGAGLAGAGDPVPPSSAYPGTAELRRLPLEIGLWWRSVNIMGELQAGIGAGMDLTLVRARAADAQKRELLPSPNAAVAAAIRMPLGSRLFFRVASGLGVNVVRYEFRGAEEAVVFTYPTQRFYGKLYLELGIALR